MARMHVDSDCHAKSPRVSRQLILFRRINSRRRGRRKKAEIVPTNLRSHVINSGVCVLAKHGYIDIIVYTNRKWPVCTAMIADTISLRCI